MTATELSSSPKLTDEALAGVVNVFYARVRADEMLGVVFNTAIPDGHWPPHLVRMASFWSSIMLTSGRYHGNPIQAHVKHREVITPAMFGRWLELWEQTARERLAPADAEAIIFKAHRMARNLQGAMFALPRPAGQHAA